MPNDEIDDLIQHYRAAAESLRVVKVACKQHQFEALAREAEALQAAVTERVDAFDFIRGKKQAMPEVRP